MSGKRPTAMDARPRMLLLARRLYEGETITARWIMSETGVGQAQACEDMALLAMYLPCEQWKRGMGHEKALRLARRMRRSQIHADVPRALQ